MFGAPDLPRRQPPRDPLRGARPDRRPGVGDHVDFYGAHIGLIVDIEGEKATVASRTLGGKVTETAFEMRLLRVSTSIPLAFGERVDSNWKKLG